MQLPRGCLFFHSSSLAREHASAHATIVWFPRVISVVWSRMRKKEREKIKGVMSIITDCERRALSESSRGREPSYDALSRLNVGRFRWYSLIRYGSSGIGDPVVLSMHPFIFFPHSMYRARVSHDANRAISSEDRSLDKHVKDSRAHVGSLYGMKWLEQMVRSNNDQNDYRFVDVSSLVRSAELLEWVIVANSEWELINCGKLRWFSSKWILYTV